MSKKHRKISSIQKTAAVPLECSAGEYFWLCNELNKARRALQASLFNGAKPEETQAYAILVEFYQKAAKTFRVRPDSISVFLSASRSDELADRVASHSSS